LEAIEIRNYVWRSINNSHHERTTRVTTDANGRFNIAAIFGVGYGQHSLRVPNSSAIHIIDEGSIGVYSTANERLAFRSFFIYLRSM